MGATGDRNHVMLASTGIGNINIESTSNYYGIFTGKVKSCMDGNLKYLYFSSLDDMINIDHNEMEKIDKGQKTQHKSQRILTSDVLKAVEVPSQPPSSCYRWMDSMAHQESSILLIPDPETK